MYLVRLIYASRAAEVNKGELGKILQKSQKNNEKLSVTGILAFDGHLFLQCLEGGRSAVNATYHRILNDPRHTDPVLLDYKEVTTRDFGAWSMAYVPDTQLTREHVIRYAGKVAFDPFAMSGASAHLMLKELTSIF